MVVESQTMTRSLRFDPPLRRPVGSSLTLDHEHERIHTVIE